MTEIVICGRGGQGVVFLTRQIGRILAEKGVDVISSETHGMAVRGGSINSHLRIGPFHSPLIRTHHADFILSLDASETSNNLHLLKPDGLIIENSTAPDEPGIRRVDAAGVARSVGMVQLENVALLAFAAGLEGFPVSVEDLRARLEQDPREHVRRRNLSALDLVGKAS
jgi:indolepyruvate ferredoxin oxidoreductase beta subunit